MKPDELESTLEVQTATKASVAPPSYEKTSPRSGYGVQVAAFETEEEAEAFLIAHHEALESLGPLFVVSSSVEGAKWFRVRVGVYPSVAAARRARERLLAPLDEGAMAVRHR